MANIKINHFIRATAPFDNKKKSHKNTKTTPPRPMNFDKSKYNNKQKKKKKTEQSRQTNIKNLFKFKNNFLKPHTTFLRNEFKFKFEFEYL